MALSPIQKQHHEQMRDILSRVSNKFLNLPGVNGMGIGFKEVGGKATNILSFRFYVDKKKDVPDQERVPYDVEGFPTDVIEFAPSRKLPSVPARTRSPEEEEPDDVDSLKDDDPKNKYDPLLGGISIGPSRTPDDTEYVGTLGLMVVDLLSGSKPAMLSNYHVMCLEDGKCKKGDEICQPSRVDRWSGWCSNCAKIDRWSLGDFTDRIGQNLGGVDAAIAHMTHREASLNKILNVPGGSAQQVSGTARAEIGDTVYKCGRTTDLTESVVEDVSGVFKSDYGPPYGKITLTKMVVTRTHFTEGGDSGSVYVNKNTNKVVALHAAGDPVHSYGCPIEAVLAALDINIP